MRVGLSQEEPVQDATTSQIDSQGKHSVQARPADERKKLTDVFQGVDTTLSGGASSLEIRQVVCDSRRVQSGALFFALHGAKAEGNVFVQDAIKRGAIGIASETQAPATPPARVVWIQVREARKALAITAANFFGHPANAL